MYVPSTAVELGRSLVIEVKDFSPNISSPLFDRLDCGITRPGESGHKIILAQYDRHALKFKTPSHGIPRDFSRRVSYDGRASFTIHQVQFADKALKVVCILNLKIGTMTSHVESQEYELKEVYGKIVFD